MAKTRHSRGSPHEQGSITPILAACLAIGLGLLALTVDLGQLFVAKNELQNIADAAALAGAKKLIQPDSTGVATVNCSGAIAEAQAVAADNKSLGATLTINNADVTVGQWDLKNSVFTKTGCSTSPVDVTAIQVTVKRDGETNASVAGFFGGILGTPTANSQATAVAYRGVAGTAAAGTVGLPFAVSSNPNGTFPGVASRAVGPRSYARANSILDWFMPRPAHATGSTTFTWKDKGGSSLSVNKGTWVMPTSSESSDGTKLKSYILGPKSGGDKYPQVQVGQKLYPVSEYNYPTWLYPDFQNLKTRFGAEKKLGSDGKYRWRTTMAAYYTNKPSAQAPPPPNSWLGLAQSLLGPRPAYACTSYPSPVIYLEGFITVDVTNVTVASSTCQNYSYTDSRSCANNCSMTVEVPVDQNFITPGTNSNPVPGQTTQQMNSSAPNGANFAAVPYLVK
jgi:Flp pilus assembly protein TadG